MRAGRLLEIVLLLQAKGCLTAQELADQCEVSVRTIYRDMRDLEHTTATFERPPDFDLASHWTEKAAQYTVEDVDEVEIHHPVALRHTAVRAARAFAEVNASA